MAANCEECVWYDYDDELDAYVCEADLDEDEMERFLRGGTRECPFSGSAAANATARRQGANPETKRHLGQPDCPRCLFSLVSHWAESQSTYSSRHRPSSVISRAASRPT